MSNTPPLRWVSDLNTKMSEQFNEDSTMQADKSKTANGKYTLPELQRHPDLVKVSEDRKIAVTVKREFSQ